jgi:hypothetical protein
MEFRGPNGEILPAQAPAVPSLLQMAQGEAPQTGTDWGAAAEPMIKDYLGGNTLEQYKQGQASGQFAPGELPAWTDKANWGPPPAYVGDGSQSFFPDAFSKRGDPAGKFWSWGDYIKQAGGQMPEVMDRRPNTLNWRQLGGAGSGLQGLGLPGGSPGDFMFMGHHINTSKLQQDLRQGTDPSGEGASNAPPIRRIQGRGPENPASFIHGSAVYTGLPGQLENWQGGQPYWT